MMAERLYTESPREFEPPLQVTGLIKAVEILQPGSVTREELQAMIVRVGDDEALLVINGHTPWTIELGWC